MDKSYGGTFYLRRGHPYRAGMVASLLQRHDQHSRNLDLDIKKRMQAIMHKGKHLDQQQIQLIPRKLGPNSDTHGSKKPRPHTHPRLLMRNGRLRAPLNSASSNISSHLNDIPHCYPPAPSAERSSGEYSSSASVSIACDRKCRQKYTTSTRRNNEGRHIKNSRDSTEHKPLKSRNNEDNVHEPMQKLDSMDFTSVSTIPENSHISLRHKSSNSTVVTGPLYSTMTYPQNSTPEDTLSSALSEMRPDEPQGEDQSCEWEATKDTAGGIIGNRSPTGRDSHFDTRSSDDGERNIDVDDEGIDADTEYGDENDNPHCRSTSHDHLYPVYKNGHANVRHIYNPLFRNSATRKYDNTCTRSTCTSNSSLEPYNSYTTEACSESSSHVYEQIFIDDIPTKPYSLSTSERPPCIGKEATPPICRTKAQCFAKVSFQQTNSNLGNEDLLADSGHMEITESSQKALISGSQALNYSVESSIHAKGILCCGSKMRSRKKGDFKKSVSKKFNKVVSKQLNIFGQ